MALSKKSRTRSAALSCRYALLPTLSFQYIIAQWHSKAFVEFQCQAEYDELRRKARLEKIKEITKIQTEKHLQLLQDEAEEEKMEEESSKTGTSSSASSAAATDSRSSSASALPASPTASSSSDDVAVNVATKESSTTADLTVQVDDEKKEAEKRAFVCLANFVSPVSL
jgi:activator of HSP90 ATPase